MTLSNPPVRAVDLADLERQISDILTSSSPENLGGRAAKVGRHEGVGALDDEPLQPIPATADAAFSRGVSNNAGQPSSRALALVVPFLIITGVGVALFMQGGSGGNPPAIEATGRMPSQSALGATAASSSNSDHPLDAASADAAPPRATLVPAAQIMSIVAADMSPPKRAAESATTFGAAPGAVGAAVGPGTTIISESRLEAAPLPPTRPRRLALAEAPPLPAKQSDLGLNGAGSSAFSVQLASARSKSEALAALSRLKKQFPGVLGGGAVRRADLGSSGVFYRVRVASLSRNAADKICSQLRTSRENCIVTRG